MPEESGNSSVEDSMMSHDAPTQSQGGPSPSAQKTMMSSSVQIKDENSRFPRFTKSDEK